MTERIRPTPRDPSEIVSMALAGIGAGADLHQLRGQLAAFHAKHDLVSAEVLLELAADALDESAASRSSPLEFETLRDSYLPECDAHTRAQHYKSVYALRAAAMLRGGVDPGLLDEASRWRTDDLWIWTLDAVLVYVRAAADRCAVPVSEICLRLALRHDVVLST